MIILVEGPRGAGKSHLIDNFFAQNTDDRFIYYKWNFAEWVKFLHIQDDNKSVHYFSLANILTILQLGNTLFKDKCLVLDRSIFSTYAWAAYRKRLLKYEIMVELDNMLTSGVYTNCKLIYVNRDDSVSEFNRVNKDIFDEYENYALEKKEFDEIFTIHNDAINNVYSGNTTVLFNNKFDIKSQNDFNSLLNDFIDK